MKTEYIVNKLLEEMQEGLFKEKIELQNLWAELHRGVDTVVRPYLEANRMLGEMEVGAAPFIGAVDGALIVEHNALFSEAKTVAVCLGVESEYMHSSFSTSHLHELEDLAKGVMAMQEAWLAHCEAQRNLVLTDGGRFATVYAIKKYHRALEDCRVRVLWDKVLDENTSLALFVKRFEEEGVLSKMINSKNILGLTKMNSSNKIIRTVFGESDAHLPKCFKKVDDRVIGNLLLKDGEYFEAVYKKSEIGFDELEGDLNMCILKINDSCIKIEFMESLKESRSLNELLNWFKVQMRSIDLMEPYLNWAADKICKEVITVYKNMAEGSLRGGNDEMIKVLMKGWRS